MAKIARKTAKIFGSSATAGQIAKFGSLAASSPVTYSGATADPANIQALGEWLDGWNSAQVGAGSPAIEDMNGFCFVDSYQIAYLLQQGIAEYDASTIYYSGSTVVDSSNNFWVSLIDNNTGHTPSSSPSQWTPMLEQLYTNVKTAWTTYNAVPTFTGGVQGSVSQVSAYLLMPNNQVQVSVFLSWTATSGTVTRITIDLPINISFSPAQPLNPVCFAVSTNTNTGATLPWNGVISQSDQQAEFAVSLAGSGQVDNFAISFTYQLS